MPSNTGLNVAKHSIVTFRENFMKTFKTFLQLTLVLASLAFFSSCDNKKSSSNATATYNTGYTYNQMGQCVQSSTGQIVAAMYCQQNNIGSGYQYNQMNQCVRTNTGQIVDSYYCQNNIGNGGYQGVQCNNSGYWIWSGYQWVQCGAGYMGTYVNCSGQTAYPSGATSQSQAVRCL